MGQLSSSHKKARTLLVAGVGILLLAALAVVLIFILPEKPKHVSPAEAPGSIKSNGVAYFYTPKGQQLCSFGVEIADTQETRTKGLMYRETMSDSTGMLFLMPRDEIQQFWMKNTYLPLDIIFIGADSTVVSVGANAQPFSEQNISSQKPALFVLEVNAGLAKHFDVKPGAKFKWSRNK